MVVYLSEQKVNSLSQAAVLADEFVLTHKGVFSVTHPERNMASAPLQNQSARIKPVMSQLKEVRDCFFVISMDT